MDRLMVRYRTGSAKAQVWRLAFVEEERPCIAWSSRPRPQSPTLFAANKKKLEKLWGLLAGSTARHVQDEQVGHGRR